MHAITGNGLRSRARKLDEVVESFSNYVAIEGKTTEQLLALVETQWRLGLLSLFHFKIDALCQNLLTALGQVPGRRGFTKNMTALFARITLRDAVHAEAVLRALTFTRNTLHNNGVHRGQAWGPFEIFGLAFEFVPDGSPQCASFAHVLAALDETTGVLQEVLDAAEIRALAFVEDPYVVLNPG